MKMFLLLVQKKFEVEIRGCFGEIPLVIAPNVVGPNATDPRKKVFLYYSII